MKRLDFILECIFGSPLLASLILWALIIFALSFIW